jgi:hypothetical protein
MADAWSTGQTALRDAQSVTETSADEDRSVPDPIDEAPASADINLPDKEQILSTRAMVQEGMSTDEITRMTEVIKSANLKLEREFMWENLYEQLSDPEHLKWNLLTQTGEVQIGWFYDGNIDQLKRTTELSEAEFNEQYGSPVITHNNFTADDFIETMEELKGYTDSELFKKDFDRLIDDMKAARETHDVSYLNSIYQTLHDMDYFLLRYGPEDVGIYTSDPTTVNKYYGILEVYQ